MERRTLSEELLRILACPNCKGELYYDRDRNVLVCRTCRVYYEIIDGIPNLIPEEAKPLEELNTEDRGAPGGI